MLRTAPGPVPGFPPPQLSRLALAAVLSRAGLQGVCLAMALSMAAQCAAVARMYRRTARAGTAGDGIVSGVS
ncbi:hypothetical protein [Streptomyces sp. BBFR115]|uniref:hypothetical protein n=1 Tax=Streptomyces sp. BBFR115 TaxID=3448173 RepID=UPI003F761A81